MGLVGQQFSSGQVNVVLPIVPAIGGQVLSPGRSGNGFQEIVSNVDGGSCVAVRLEIRSFLNADSTCRDFGVHRHQVLSS